MAQITWTEEALRMFTQEQRDAAAGSPAPQWVPPEIDYASGDFALPVSGGSRDPNLGRVDPDQMFADGFVYVGGKWVRADSAEARTAGQPQATGGPRPGLASVSALAFIPGGSVLGYQVPTAPPVLLPSFVGGRLGQVSIGQGMRPQSGGTARVRFGVGILPEVRM